MTKMFTYDDAFDMSSWSILTDFAGGDFGVETADKFTVLSATQKYVFAGSGFTYDSNGMPTDGTITHLKVLDQSNGAFDVQVSHMDLTVQQLETFALTNDVNGFESAIFSGNNTFNVGNSDFHNSNAVVHLNGFGGNDTFNIGYDFNPADTFDGGTGYNTVDLLTLDPNYIGPGTFQNIQKIVLTGNGPDIDIEDPNISGGKTLTVDASHVTASPGFQIFAQLSVNVHLIGSAGGDLLVGGTGNDQLTGGLGSDMLIGNGGHDTYIYNSVAESTGSNFDSIAGFDPKLDHFKVPVAVTGIDPALTTGTLDDTQFDADFSAALAGHLEANHAILFAPDSGTDKGYTFLIIDQNGQAGYQAGGDLVMLVDGGGGTHAQNLDLLSAANFIV
ncbi:MAG TPA: calcium-binding protein [Rhizomicrobium sp.]